VFSGLILASVAALTAPTALFQRKSRAGWLEELDGIREASLDGAEEGVDAVGEAEDIWTDLRAGGEYVDPHEISSLYATDATPDDPGKGKRKQPRPRPARSGTAGPAPEVASPTPEATTAPSTAELPPPPPPPPSVEAPPLPGEPAPPLTTPSTGDADQLWIQPAPHPVHPNEMWHPAELTPTPLVDADQTGPVAHGAGPTGPSPDQPTPSYDRLRTGFLADDDPSSDPVVPDVAEADADPASEPSAAAATAASRIDGVFDPARLETELVGAAESTVFEPPMPTRSAEDLPLISGPIARKVRRDRPRNVLPGSASANANASTTTTEATPASAIFTRDERSPLPEPPLPPAAVPTRVASGAAPFAEPGSAPVGPDGLVDVPGTIVRLGRAGGSAGAVDPELVAVTLGAGWCWVAPGEGAPLPVRIDLQDVTFTVHPGSTAVAVVEGDGSSFVIVADGSATLRHRSGTDELVGGTIVLIDGDGGIQADQATLAEIESDPIVAENLAADAEL
jgi:hypothetical protein